ncbi:MAG: hypothetical protein K0Q99_2297 [Clostridia bacterium]|jgi:hypothetical protein|nr:hypothetical protein [Clostridia bacterium]
MRNLFKNIINKFSNRNKDNNESIESICNHPSGDLKSYCSLEYISKLR